MSFAKLMIKHSIGKINIDFDPLMMAEKSGIEIMNFSGADAVLLGAMPFHHKGPFDRMIIAQALTNKCPIMTDDLKFMKYECKVLWSGGTELDLSWGPMNAMEGQPDPRVTLRILKLAQSIQES